MEFGIAKWIILKIETGKREEKALKEKGNYWFFGILVEDIIKKNIN